MADKGRHIAAHQGVTFAAVLEATALRSETVLRTLKDLTREAVRDAVLDAVANPAESAQPRGGRQRTAQLEVVKLVVALEQPRHFHVAHHGSPGCAVV